MNVRLRKHAPLLMMIVLALTVVSLPALVSDSKVSDSESILGSGEIPVSDLFNGSDFNKADPEAVYSINSAEDLQIFSDYVDSGGDTIGTHFVLASDISLSGEWVPIGTVDMPFAGRFDGCDYTISGLTITSARQNALGFFGCIGEDGSVSNLNMDVKISVGSNMGLSVGAVTGYNCGMIKNCSVSGTIDIISRADFASAGGIAGCSIGLISDCSNSAEISSQADEWEAIAGGMAGLLESGNISECSNSGGVVVYSNSSKSSSGGIAGHNVTGTISRCINSGAVLIVSDSQVVHSMSSDIADILSSGGIIGCNEGTIIDCGNMGNVSLTSAMADSAVGGIAGCCHNGGTISGSYNTAPVIADTSYTSCSSAGICGWNYGEISSCFNSGKIDAISEKSPYAGGIAGWNLVTVSNCYNTGMVFANSKTSEVYAGGIVAENYWTAVISNCYNTGNILAFTNYTKSYAGGITANNDGVVENSICFTLNIEGITASGITGVNEGTLLNNYSRSDLFINDEKISFGTADTVSGGMWDVGSVLPDNVLRSINWIWDHEGKIFNDGELPVLDMPVEQDPILPPSASNFSLHVVALAIIIFAAIVIFAYFISHTKH